MFNRESIFASDFFALVALAAFAARRGETSILLVSWSGGNEATVPDSERERGPHAKATAPTHKSERIKRVFIDPMAAGVWRMNGSARPLTNHRVGQLINRLTNSQREP
jgi:hypothetical protein